MSVTLDAFHRRFSTEHLSEAEFLLQWRRNAIRTRHNQSGRLEKNKGI